MAQGKCGKCNSDNLEYFDREDTPWGENFYYEIECLDCGALGKEWYVVRYDETTVDADDES